MSGGQEVFEGKLAAKGNTAKDSSDTRLVSQHGLVSVVATGEHFLLSSLEV